MLIVLACMAVVFAACNNKDKNQNAALDTNAKKEVKVNNTSEAEVNEIPSTEISFEEPEYDFGTIPSGEVVEHTFKFKNTGDNDLIIKSAKPSCGCTVSNFPKKPIAPGEGGEIPITFNSKNRSQHQSKTIRVLANTEPKETVLKIKGFVEPAPSGEGPVR